MSKIFTIFAIIFFFSFSAIAKAKDKCTSVEECVTLIQNKISSNLVVDENFKGEVIKIEFKLNDYAEVRSPKVTANSGIKYIELEGLKALKKSSPFSELLYLKSDDFEKFKYIRLSIEI